MSNCKPPSHGGPPSPAGSGLPHNSNHMHNKTCPSKTDTSHVHSGPALHLVATSRFTCYSLNIYIDLKQPQVPHQQDTLRHTRAPGTLTRPCRRTSPAGCRSLPYTSAEQRKGPSAAEPVTGMGPVRSREPGPARPQPRSRPRPRPRRTHVLHGPGPVVRVDLVAELRGEATG